MKDKIAILTTFWEYNHSFSLTGVVDQQLKALVKYDYQPVLFVLTNFNDEDKVPKGVEIRKIPQIILEPYGAGNTDKLEEDSDKVKLALEEQMADISVCLAHDIIFINTYLPYNIGVRKAIAGKCSHVKWLHWMHSGPSFATLNGSVWDNLHTLPENSKLVYMNNTDVVRAAEHYHILPKDVRVISNPMDIREIYDFHPLTKELIEENDLMKPDYLAVYPLSTTRMDDAGKKLRKAIWIMAEIKKRGNSVAFVIPNAHANAQNEKDEIERMYQFAYEKGMERRELIFTSLHNTPKYELGVPHKVVTDLFLLSNLFIFPSHSENCPLVLLEAMAGKSLLVLNGDFPAFYEFGGENALYFRFGSTVAPSPEFPDGEGKYYSDIAILVESEMNQNKAVKAQTKIRQRFNIDYVFKHQLEPAIREIQND